MDMKSWQQAARDSLVPGVIAGLATCATVAARGLRDSGSAMAPINASGHVVWGDRAAMVEGVSPVHTPPALAINMGAATWWAFVFQKLFGATVNRHGWPAALLGGAATSGIAYCTDYHVLPRRLTPGWEKRISDRSLGISLGVMAAGIAVGAMLVRRRGR